MDGFGMNNETYICANCGATVNANNAFCTNCGTPRAALQAIRCTNCNSIIEAGKTFCTNCGQRVGMAPQQPGFNGQPMMEAPQQPYFNGQPMMETPQQPFNGQPMMEAPQQPFNGQPIMEAPQQPFNGQPIMETPGVMASESQQMAEDNEVTVGAFADNIPKFSADASMENMEQSNAFVQNDSFGQSNQYVPNESHMQNNQYGQNEPYMQNNQYGQDGQYMQNDPYAPNGQYGQNGQFVPGGQPVGGKPPKAPKVSGKKNKMPLIISIISAVVVLLGIIVWGLYTNGWSASRYFGQIGKGNFACMFVHDFADPDCTHGNVCRRCQYEIGEPEGHDWVPATCTVPETCSKCSETQAPALGHTARIGYCGNCNNYIDELEPEYNEIRTYIGETIISFSEAAAAIEKVKRYSLYRATNLLLTQRKLQEAKDQLQKAANACGNYEEFAEAKAKLQLAADTVNTTSSNIDVLDRDAAEALSYENEAVVILNKYAR